MVRYNRENNYIHDSSNNSWINKTHIDIENNYFSRANRIFAHMQKQDITLKTRQFLSLRHNGMKDTGSYN